MSKQPMEDCLYIVEGVDPTGRKFYGAYSYDEAQFLIKTDPQNKIIQIKTRQEIML